MRHGREIEQCPLSQALERAETDAHATCLMNELEAVPAREQCRQVLARNQRER